jgi:hypothetical protein
MSGIIFTTRNMTISFARMPKPPRFAPARSMSAVSFFLICNASRISPYNGKYFSSLYRIFGNEAILFAGILFLFSAALSRS